MYFSTILYELLTGSVPEGAILPPHVVRSDVPRAMSNSVLVALAPAPKSRFASWDAFQKALNGANARLEPATLAKWIGGAGAAVLVAVLLINPEPDTVEPRLAKTEPSVPPVSQGRILDDPRIISAGQPPSKSETVVMADQPTEPLSSFQPKPNVGTTVLPSILALVEQRLVGTMLSIPAGELTLGDSVGDGDADERPTLRKRIAAFRLGRAEVTRAQFYV